MLRRLFKPTDGRGVLALIATVFGGVAVILLLIAGGIALHTWSFLATSEAATGTVVGFDARHRCTTKDHVRTCSAVYAPRVRFATADGREIEYQSSTATNPPSYDEGQQVDLRYRPEDPHQARINSYVDLWLAPTIVGGIGGIFGAVAAILLVIRRAMSSRQRRAQPVAGPVREPEEPDGWQDPGTLR